MPTRYGYLANYKGNMKSKEIKLTILPLIDGFNAAHIFEKEPKN